MKTKNIYLANNWYGYYPVGASAVIVAENEKVAKRLFKKKLKEMKLLEKNDDDKENYEFELLDIENNNVVILQDGDC